MSFLDRFKRKASDEKSENAPEVKPDTPKEGKTDSPTGASGRKPDPATAAAVASGYSPDLKLAPKKEAPATAADSGPQHEVTLELGDFLPRLPASLLKEETPDPKTALKFDIAELADRISRGQTTISLV